MNPWPTGWGFSRFRVPVTDYHTVLDDRMTSLEKAITYWEQGEPIPLDLAVQLMSEGLDVESLEEQHLN